MALSVMKILWRAWLVYFFLVALFLVNGALAVALVLRLVRLLSETQYRRFANWCTGSTWCFYPLVFEQEGHHRVQVHGMAPPSTRRVLVLANHVEAPDWSVVFWLATAVDHLRHLKARAPPHPSPLLFPHFHCFFHLGLCQKVHLLRPLYRHWNARHGNCFSLSFLGA